ncbi:MAG: hypothetical protein ACRD4X_16380 [Candidatus Acidiferrales bacterium]
MSTSMEEDQELAERVGRLERQNRFWKIGGIAAIAALAVSLTATLWAQERVFPRGAERALRVQTVESEHFVLKDADGTTRGEFAVTPTGPVLELLGPDGKVIWSTKGGMRAAGE